MNTQKTGNKSLDKWINFFSKKTSSQTRFIKLLKKEDRSFLTISPPQDIESTEYPDSGLLEPDFRQVAFEDDPKNPQAKTRIILAMVNNVNFAPWKEKYKDTFYDVMEKSLIEGDYEKYDISFEKTIALALEKNWIEKSEFGGVAFLRGILLGSRYPTEAEEKALQKMIKKNKIKLLLNI